MAAMSLSSKDVRTYLDRWDKASGNSLGVRDGKLADVSKGLPQEVGLTDQVMLRLWENVDGALDVTSPAESGLLGADLAIIQKDQRRIIIFQSKVVASGNYKGLRLKSPLSVDQRDKLRSDNVVEVGEHEYSKYGALALYQNQAVALNCHIPSHSTSLWDVKPEDRVSDKNAIAIARRSRHGESWCGVLAAPVLPDTCSVVEHQSLVPWEVLFHAWVNGFPELWSRPGFSSGADLGAQWMEPYVKEEVIGYALPGATTEPVADVIEPPRRERPLTEAQMFRTALGYSERGRRRLHLVFLNEVSDT